MSKNNSTKNTVAILGVGLVINLILIVLFLVNHFIQTFLPTGFDENYLIYASVILSPIIILLSLRLLLARSTLRKAPLDYLRDTNKELNEVADKSESILNAIGDGVVLIDGENNIKFSNPAAAHILGWEAEDTIGLNYSSVLKLVDEQETELTSTNNVIAQALGSNSEMRPPTLTMKTKSGKKILVSVVVSPIGGEGQGVIAIFRDVTKEKAEEREQAEFISTASHEMRTPVASIEGYLGLVLNPATATIDARAKEYIEKAQNSAHHLGRLFQDLLDISKADDNRMTSNPEITDVVALIEPAIDDLKLQADEKNLELIFKPAQISTSGMTKLQPIFYSNVDQGHLRELVTNLTENAIKYTPHGSITIDVTGDTDHVVISVTDTGIGIPSEDIPHLFQKFYRVDNKETNEVGGTGLGLYLVRKLAEALEGRVWAESEYGRGTTFNIELSRSTSLTTPINPAPTPSPIPTPIPTITTPVKEFKQAEEPTSPMSNYTVPRGETLTAEQKAAYVKKLSQMNQNEVS